MAADLEANINEPSELIQSSGGVFEVERDNKLIFSKKATGRFPEEGEVLAICHALDNGTSLEKAQADAAANIRKPPSFGQWLSGFLQRK